MLEERLNYFSIHAIENMASFLPYKEAIKLARAKPVKTFPVRRLVKFINILFILWICELFQLQLCDYLGWVIIIIPWMVCSILSPS